MIRLGLPLWEPGLPAIGPAQALEISGEIERCLQKKPNSPSAKPLSTKVKSQTHPLFRIEAGIPCQSAREQASELMGYARDMTLDGLMEDKPQLIWASHYLCALAKALMDDAELGMMKTP